MWGHDGFKNNFRFFVGKYAIIPIRSISIATRNLMFSPLGRGASAFLGWFSLASVPTAGGYSYISTPEESKHADRLFSPSNRITNFTPTNPRILCFEIQLHDTSPNPGT